MFSLRVKPKHRSEDKIDGKAQSHRKSEIKSIGQHFFEPQKLNVFGCQSQFEHRLIHWSRVRTVQTSSQFNFHLFRINYIVWSRRSSQRKMHISQLRPSQQLLPIAKERNPTSRIHFTFSNKQTKGKNQWHYFTHKNGRNSGRTAISARIQVGAKSV